MAKLTLRFSMVVMFVTLLNVSCGGGSSLLSSGSSLMNALGGASNLGGITKLLQTPGLGKLLGGAMKKPFTLLAPTDNALGALGGDALANLTKPENLSGLADMLKKHIVPGKLDAASLLKGGLNSAGGNPLNLAGANLGNLIPSDKANIIPIDKILQ